MGNAIGTCQAKLKIEDARTFECMRTEGHLGCHVGEASPNWHGSYEDGRWEIVNDWPDLVLLIDRVRGGA